MEKPLVIVAVTLVLVAAVLLPVIPTKHTVLVPQSRTETYTETEPYQDTEERTQSLVDDKPTVSAGQYIYYSRYVDVAGKQQNFVAGKVTETAGYDINFFVFDQKGFNAWKQGGSSAAYVDARRIASQDYRFVPDHTDYYYFVLDNTFSWFTNKVPSVTATWSYQETVTKYRDVQKTRTITEDVEVTETKMTSLLALLLGL